MKKVIVFVLVLLAMGELILAQSTDTLKELSLGEFTVRSYKENSYVSKLPLLHQTYIINGIKTQVIQVANQNTNFSDKIGRQLFAKVPGTFVYDMDGSGNQINVATRGLDPHRSWEFNIRQNGVMINSDLYGYPASHYSPPLESIASIEMVKGTASMQYGAEFGGMVNYVTKTADTTKRFGLETITTIGSFGVASSYNAIGGKLGKVSYYGYQFNRTSDGYRKNSKSKSNAQFLSLQYAVNSKLCLKAEFGRSTYSYQLPGPLNDSMFLSNPQASTRSRNFYSPEIYVPSITLDYQISNSLKLNCIVSGVFGSRNSVLFDAFATVPDIIDPTTGSYKSRIVDIDKFNSKTAELRLLKTYNIGKFKNVVSAGMRYFNNDLHRRQRGIGTSGVDFDLSISGDWGRNLRFKSKSLAVSIENMVYLTDRFTVSIGARYEHGSSVMSGTISVLDPAAVPNTIKHRVPVFGANAKYKWDYLECYAGIAQAYRPVLFKDIIPTSVLEKANKDLRNAYGYNAELGLNGKLGDYFKFDLTGFLMQYNNRLGNLLITEQSQNFIYKTNIGDSKTFGLEALVEYNVKLAKRMYLNVFTSTSLMRGVYENAVIANGGTNLDISGNQLESVPQVISRNGVNWYYRSFSAGLLGSYVDQTFSDPTNQAVPSANGARGLVPSYFLLDLNLGLQLNTQVKFRLGINNLANLSYFTKRPLFYPGPGIWPSDGRSFNFSVEAKF